MELTLLQFEVQAYLLKGLQDPLDIFLVFLESITVDQYVIEICGVESIEVGGQNIIDEILKYRQGIGKAKWHD
jgi:hypothetical protein